MISSRVQSSKIHSNRQSRRLLDNPQVWCMGLLTLVFLGGVLLYTVLPEGPVRILAMIVFTSLVPYALFRLGRRRTTSKG